MNKILFVGGNWDLEGGKQSKIVNEFSKYLVDGLKEIIHTFLSEEDNESIAEEFFQNEHVDYHAEFFRNGFNSLIKMWLINGCKETPEELEKILETEYSGRSAYIEKYFSSERK